MDSLRLEELAAIARQMRQRIFKAAINAAGGHISGSLSPVEILTVLYHEILNVNSREPRWDGRDRFILSKGHACLALYAALASRGFIEPQEMLTFGKSGTRLGGHPDMHKVPGAEASTGSLGHGFPFGCGIALAAKRNQWPFRVFAMTGDGECQEGTVWEAALFAAQHQLDNLTVIVDYNKLQAMDRIEKITGLEPLRAKWEAFGWEAREVDGHDIAALHEALSRVPFRQGKPSALIAHTIKGRGVSYMEQVPIWHFRMPNAEEMATAQRELGLRPEEMMTP
ncbi:MAG: transketolase [Candidatus Sumerlaeota bacterium]|nr:transketolase [Candidatus Sumerlaeota bacterium]